MAKKNTHNLLRRLRTLIESVDTLDSTRTKLGLVRLKPLFSEYNLCIEELKSDYPTMFEQLQLEELPLYDEEGKERFTVGKLSTLLHQSKSVVAFLEGQLPASENSLEFPDKVTLAWLWEKVPAKFWCTLVGLLIASFLFGVTVGQVAWVGEIFGNRTPRGGVSSQIAIPGKPKRVTISKAEINLTGPGFYFVGSQGDLPSVDLKRINGLAQGDQVILASGSNKRTVVLKKGPYLRMPMDFYLNNQNDRIVFISNGADVCSEISRASND